jgi:hypothetical protein
MSLSARPRAVLALLGTAVLALFAASPAHAATGTPTTPTDLYNGNQSCSTDMARPVYLWAGNGLNVEGIPGDTDPSVGPTVSLQYQVWPVADPSQVTSVTRNYAALGYESIGNLPSEALTDGQTYAWRAQTVVGDQSSDWSAPCYVTIDDTRPANAPTVTSPNYPQGQWNPGGTPVRFVLDANVANDVAGFEFSWQQDLPIAGIAEIGSHGIPAFQNPYDDPKYFVRADTLGGSATLDLVPPTGSGPMRLWVATLDRAYNRSEVTNYLFYVSSTAPTVTPPDPAPRFGKPATFTLAPNPAQQSVSPVVSYTVSTSGGQHDTTVQVPAAADGTAQVTLTVDGLYNEFVDVRSTSATGWVSDPGGWYSYYDSTPTVNSDVYTEYGSSDGAGVPATFTFAPKVPDVASYTYSFNGEEPITIRARAHHTARLTWTPPESGSYDLEVFATTRSGIRTAPYDYFFSVN